MYHYQKLYVKTTHSSVSQTGLNPQNPQSVSQGSVVEINMELKFTPNSDINEETIISCLQFCVEKES